MQRGFPRGKEKDSRKKHGRKGLEEKRWLAGNRRSETANVIRLRKRRKDGTERLKCESNELVAGEIMKWRRRPTPGAALEEAPKTEGQRRRKSSGAEGKEADPGNLSAAATARYGGNREATARGQPNQKKPAIMPF